MVKIEREFNQAFKVCHGISGVGNVYAGHRSHHETRVKQPTKLVNGLITYVSSYLYMPHVPQCMNTKVLQHCSCVSHLSMYNYKK